MQKLLIIDVFNFLHRAYHALPKTFSDANGNPTNAVYGVTSMLLNTLEVVRPTHVLAALDSKAPTFRVEDFTGYKAHRRPMEDDLSKQIQPVFDILSAFGIPMITADGYEADDIIGTVVFEVLDDDIEVIICSNDRDLWQLLRPSVLIMLPSTKKGSPEWVGYKEAQTRMGFPPELIPEYKGLRGDVSDNIPGVYGVGEKTAISLITLYGSIDTIYANIDKVTPASLQKKLLEGYEQAVMSRELAKIVTNVPIEFDLSSCKYHEFNKLKVKDALEKYNFKSLIKRMGFDVVDKRSVMDATSQSSLQVSLF